MTTRYLLLLAALFLTACSPVSTTKPLVTNGDLAPTPSSFGNFRMASILPSDWPKDVPVYTEASLLYTGTRNAKTGDSGSFLIMRTNDDVKTVAAFYTSALPLNDWKLLDPVAKPDGSLVLLGGEKGGRATSVTIIFEEKATTIVIGVQAKPEK